MNAAERLLALAQGRLRQMSDREIAERDFAGFFVWLKEKGVANPYYHYSKEAWVLWRFQRDYNAYLQGEQAKTQIDQQRAAVINLLKTDPALGKGIVFTTIQGWTKEQREELLVLLTPPSAVQDVPTEVLPPGLLDGDADPVGAS